MAHIEALIKHTLLLVMGRVVFWPKKGMCREALYVGLQVEAIYKEQPLLRSEASACGISWWRAERILRVSPHAQVEAIKKNRPLLVVGTPGRLAELSRAGALQTHPTGILVLDEVRQNRLPPTAAAQRTAHHAFASLGRVAWIIASMAGLCRTSPRELWC